MELRSKEYSFVFPSAIMKKRFVGNTSAINIINARSSGKKIVNSSSDDARKVASFSFFPTFALPMGLHGCNISFLDSDQNGVVTSIQAYSQFARHFKLPDKKDYENDSYLDSYSLRTRCLAKKANLFKMFLEMMKTNSFGFRIEIGICVSALNRDGISQAIYEALKFHSENVVAIETSPMLMFSFNWASFACNLELLSIECLRPSIVLLSDRLCHLTLCGCYADLFRLFVSGRTFSPTSRRFASAYKSLNFPLLPRPSQNISNILKVDIPSLEQVKDQSLSSENDYAAVIIYIFFTFILVIYLFFVFQLYIEASCQKTFSCNRVEAGISKM